MGMAACSQPKGMRHKPAPGVEGSRLCTGGRPHGVSLDSVGGPSPASLELTSPRHQFPASLSCSELSKDSVRDRQHPFPDGTMEVWKRGLVLSGGETNPT